MTTRTRIPRTARARARSSAGWSSCSTRRSTWVFIGGARRA
jgi:hypothetical protein